MNISIWDFSYVKIKVHTNQTKVQKKKKKREQNRTTTEKDYSQYIYWPNKCRQQPGEFSFNIQHVNHCPKKFKTSSTNLTSNRINSAMIRLLGCLKIHIT